MLAFLSSLLSSLLQLSKVTEELLGKGKTVGELVQLVVDYCEQRIQGKTNEQLFTVLLQS